MATSGTSLGDSWNARMRLIRMRRKRESFRLREEFRLVPVWLRAPCLFLYIVAVGVAVYCMHDYPEMRPYDMRENAKAAALAVAGIITVMALVIATFLFALAYVNRDAKRRGMNSTLWTLIVLLFLPSYGLIGFIIYFLFRDPLPYACPRCQNLVGPRFNFCPNCKCNLHPTCPSCKETVAETDKYCPYCATELPASPLGLPPPLPPTAAPRTHGIRGWALTASPAAMV